MKETYNFTYTERVEKGSLCDEIRTEFEGPKSDYDNTLFFWRYITKNNPQYSIDENLYDEGRELVLHYKGDEGLVLTKVLYMEF